jgi:hypothetical protein
VSAGVGERKGKDRRNAVAASTKPGSESKRELSGAWIAVAGSLTRGGEPAERSQFRPNQAAAAALQFGGGGAGKSESALARPPPSASEFKTQEEEEGK